MRGRQSNADQFHESPFVSKSKFASLNTRKKRVVAGLSALALSGSVITYFATSSFADESEKPKVTIINDSQVGDGLNQVKYTGDWVEAEGEGKYKDDDHYSQDTDATVTVRFEGTRVSLFGARVAGHGIGAVKVDDGKESYVDWNTTGEREDGVRMWTSAVLSEGEHTVTLRVTGKHTEDSSGAAINFDRAVVSSSGEADPEPTTSPSQAATTSAAPKPTATETVTEKPKPPVSKQGDRFFGMPNRSGLPWASGVFDPQWGNQEPEAFGNWRGRKVDVIEGFIARKSWADIVGENSDSYFNSFKGSEAFHIMSVPPIPDSGGSLEACANGAYDDEWVKFAKKAKAAGFENKTIIRLGWEFNGDWYAWSAHQPKTFAACFRQVHDAMESVAPGFIWDWNVNRGRSHSAKDKVRDAYPGDKYVDIIGVDSYDGYPGVTSNAMWNEHVNGRDGLNDWVKFARAHGKKISVPEWGVYPGTAWAGNNGGDNPAYIKRMFDFFTANADILAYESYFNEPDGYYAGALHSPNLNPKASAMYEKLWREGPK